MFSFIRKGLGKTLGAIKEILPEKVEKIDKALLEDILIESDIPYELIEEIFYYLPPSDKIAKADLQRVLKAYFVYETPTQTPLQKPFVELIIGVNGAGKTTTIAKLAHNYTQQGHSVLLGAADTFRAAAIEQLKSWATKINVGIVFTAQGHDPSAVAYDTISSAIAKKIDHVIIDTAGRLHNHVNLSNEPPKRSSLSTFCSAPFTV